MVGEPQKRKVVCSLPMAEDGWPLRPSTQRHKWESSSKSRRFIECFSFPGTGKGIWKDWYYQFHLDKKEMKAYTEENLYQDFKVPEVVHRLLGEKK